MPQMKNVITALKDAGCKARVLIGGAPVTQNYADEIGADGYAPDAASAVDAAKQLLAVAAAAPKAAPAKKVAAKKVAAKKAAKKAPAKAKAKPKAKPKAKKAAPKAKKTKKTKK
jgi:cobalamin-dependent methionine synthase I